eukprot:4981348-Pyramimonas_sp.AAC.1
MAPRRNSQDDPWRWNRETSFWHASGSSNGCLPTRQFPQWKWTVAGPVERELEGRVYSLAQGV